MAATKPSVSSWEVANSRARRASLERDCGKMFDGWAGADDIRLGPLFGAHGTRESHSRGDAFLIWPHPLDAEQIAAYMAITERDGSEPIPGSAYLTVTPRENLWVIHLSEYTTWHYHKRV